MSKYQRGFIDITVGDMVFAAALFAAICATVGGLIVWLAPMVWGLVKPILLALLT